MALSAAPSQSLHPQGAYDGLEDGEIEGVSVGINEGFKLTVGEALGLELG